MYTPRFTSSQIYRLMSNGKKKDEPGNAFYTYIQEKKWEAELGRPLATDEGGKATSWGLVCERYLLEHKLGMEYIPMMNEPVVHSEIDRWSGSPDARNTEMKSVVELKSPYTLKSFCGLAEPIKKGLTGLDAMNYIRANHDDGEKYYWQCVSNFILTKEEVVEFMFFMPKYDELDEIKRTIEMFGETEQYKFWWLANSHNDDLPYLLPESKYDSIYRIEFVPPNEDIEAINQRIKTAASML